MTHGQASTGTVNAISLAVVPPQANGTSSQTPISVDATLEAILQAIVVLLVEDNRKQANQVASTLESLGATVIRADSLDQAKLSLRDNKRIKVILSDVSLSDDRGFGTESILDLAEWCENENYDLPFVTLSVVAEGMQKNMLAKHLKVVRCLVKPVRPAQLAEAIRSAVADGHSSDEGNPYTVDALRQIVHCLRAVMPSLPVDEQDIFSRALPSLQGKGHDKAAIDALFRLLRIYADVATRRATISIEERERFFAALRRKAAIDTVAEFVVRVTFKIFGWG